MIIWRPFRTFWSNFYWEHIKHAKTDCAIAGEHLRHGDESAEEYLCRIDDIVMDAFTYKHDGVEELGDSVPPPAEMYSQVVQDGFFSDDCDGYHACLYHLAYKNSVDCELLSILSGKNKWGHAVLTYTDEDGKYHIHDYKRDYCGNDLNTLIKTVYSDVCGGVMLVFESKYDYRLGKWHNVPRKTYVLRENEGTK